MSVKRRGLPRAPGVAAPADRRFHRAEIGGERRRGYARRRLLRRAALAIAVGAAVAWAGLGLASSSLLFVRHVQVSGNTHLEAREVEALVDGLRDESILRVDLDLYRQRVLESSWVADASISRLLPATIQIRVTERTPAAVARHDSQLYLVDERGSIIDDYGPRYRQFDLPVVDGLIMRQTGDAIRVDADRASLMAGLLRALATRRDLVDRISQINVSNAHDAMVMFDDDPAWVHVGNRAFLERLERYVELRPAFTERFGALDYADLRFDSQIYVRGRDRDRVQRTGSN